MKTFTRRFRMKAYLKLVTVTRACPLSFEERVCFSYLVAAAKYGKTYCAANLAELSGLHASRTIPACVKRLVSLDLARVTGGQIEPIEPTGENRKWFTFFDRKNEGDTVWHCFRNVPVPVREHLSPLTWRQAALLGYLYSFAGKGSSRTGMTRSGLAVMLRCSRQTVQTALEKLVELKLVEIFNHKFQRDGFAFVLPKLTGAQLQWFLDTPAVSLQDPDQYEGFSPDDDDTDDEELAMPPKNPSVVQQRKVTMPEEVDQEDEKTDDEEDDDDTPPIIAVLAEYGIKGKRFDTVWNLMRKCKWSGETAEEKFESIVCELAILDGKKKGKEIYPLLVTHLERNRIK